MREMEKEILGDLNCTKDKMNRDRENKTLRRCSNYALSKPIVDNRLKIYGEGSTQISLSSSTTIGLLARIQDR